MAYRLEQNIWTMRTSTGALTLEDIARSHLRPFYLYDLEDALMRADLFCRSSFAVHFAMKANTNPTLLRRLANRGVGADVVSLGELQKAVANGFEPKRIVFSGVAKDREELEAALHHDIAQINVESFAELQLLSQICLERRCVARVGLRINIRLSAPTHAFVQTTTPDSKFGIDLDQLPEVLDWVRGRAELRVVCLATHIGSQIEDLDTFGQMAGMMGRYFKDLKGQGLPLTRLDLGGGLGIDYRGDGEDDLKRGEKYLQRLQQCHGTDAEVIIEPGRFICARMGVLLAKVIYVKQTSTQNFVILNAGMNFLMRPALYGAYHRISPVRVAAERDTYTVVGPICESTDKFAVDREMGRVQRGDWVAVFDAGAYGATMANGYNETPLPKEYSYVDGVWEVS